jgi:hypothetical protein
VDGKIYDDRRKENAVELRVELIERVVVDELVTAIEQLMQFVGYVLDTGVEI